jgi:hypothetical protein
MSIVTNTALDLITDALREIKVLAAGETPSPESTADAMRKLNNLMESWSIEHNVIYSVVENILNFNAGQYQYTIGNPDGGTFSGTTSVASPVITGTTIPLNMIVGGTVYDSKNGGQNVIPVGTTITAFDPVGLTVTMSNNALASSSGADVITYTVPGDFDIARPLRITNAFTRITASGSTGLDYPIDFEGGRDKYTAIGLKGIQAPWPIVGWYNPTFPLGNVYFYPNPSGFGQLHLFTDVVLNDFQTPTDPINLPQGYARALSTNLALELASEYGKQPSAMLLKRAAESLAMVKALNSTPAVQAFYDRDIVRANRTDAGWIMHGGFR